MDAVEVVEMVETEPGLGDSIKFHMARLCLLIGPRLSQEDISGDPDRLNVLLFVPQFLPPLKFQHRYVSGRSGTISRDNTQRVANLPSS